MTTAYDPIPELQKLGYTEREAAFLYLVGLHSGYFLRRQFLSFVERADGALVQRFLQKAMKFQHVHPMEYATNRHIYHLKAKPIYRLLGQEDSQNRRVKGDREIKTRLLQVDYLLDYFGDQFLETAEQKVRFFQEKLKLPLESMPQATYRNHGTPCYFPDGFPITVEQEQDEPAPIVHLIFLDDGLRSLSAFLRWLEQHRKLINSLHRVEVVYVSDSSRNFEGAEREFLRRFPRKTASEELPMGLEHFLLWLRVRSSYDRGGGRLKPDGIRLLDEGDRLYTGLEMRVLLAGRKNGSINEAGIRARFEPRLRRITFRSHLFPYTYPVWSLKYRRSVL